MLTPHDGEFTRLAGRPPGPDRLGAARGLASDAGAVVLLKGPTTVVAAPNGRVLLAAAGDSRLATAGAGDVLAGIIGAFLARGAEPFSAAAAAAHVHGRLVAGVGKGDASITGVAASDLAARLMAVLTELSVDAAAYGPNLWPGRLMRPTWVSVDLTAVARNVAAFDRLVGDTAVCAVVKADGYGHGAAAVATAAVDAGATWLAVALIEEAAELRSAGLTTPILVLSEPRPDEMAEVVALEGVRPTLYTSLGIEACAEAARNVNSSATGCPSSAPSPPEGGHRYAPSGGTAGASRGYGAPSARFRPVP